MTHDRHLLDRVSTRVLALDGRGGARPYASYDQWEAQQKRQPMEKRETPLAPAIRAPRPAARRLSYLEQREWDGLEAAVDDTESRLAEARRRAEDPSIATDADMLQKRLSEVDELQARVNRLYERWAELDDKQK